MDIPRQSPPPPVPKPENPHVDHADTTDEPAFDEVETVDEDEFGEPVTPPAENGDEDDWDKSEI